MFRLDLRTGLGSVCVEELADQFCQVLRQMRIGQTQGDIFNRSGSKAGEWSVVSVDAL